MVDLSLMVQHRCFTKRGAIRIQEIDIERLELQLLPKPIHLQRANPESSLWIELGIRLESIFPNQLLDSLSRRRFLGLHNRRQILLQEISAVPVRDDDAGGVRARRGGGK